MPFYVVVGYAEHDVGTVGVERVRDCEVDAGGVVDCAARGERFLGVVGVETEEVRDLTAEGVDH